jgi:tetratricopeptide (TPR) repeat protein
MHLGMFEAAERLFHESVASCDQNGVGNDLGTAKKAELLGLAQESQGKFTEASRAFSRARSIFQSVVGDSHLNTALATAFLARVYVASGRHGEAEPLFEHALKILEDKKAPGCCATIALTGLGLIRQGQGRHAEAIAYFDRSLAIHEKVHGLNSGECAELLHSLSRSCEAVGERRRAIEAARRALSIKRD